MKELFTSKFLLFVLVAFVVSSGISYALMNKELSPAEASDSQMLNDIIVDAAIDQALEYSVNGVYGKSFPILYSLAGKGIIRAKLYLAVAYYHGQGTKTDKSKAKGIFIELLDKEYESGIAQTYLSLIGYSEF